MKETRIHQTNSSEAKGLGSLSSFSFLIKPTAETALKSASTPQEQLSDDEQKLLQQLNPRKYSSKSNKSKLFSHTHLEFRGQQTTEF